MDKKLRRGDIWIVDWSPARGSEQAGMRPAVVVQNRFGEFESSLPEYHRAYSEHQGKIRTVPCAA